MALSESSRVLPPGFSEKAFDDALDSISKVIGSENVSRDASSGNLPGPAGEVIYGDVWPMSGTARVPSGAIRPETTEEVQKVLKVATEHGLPLWTTSRGKNLGYGGSAPVVKGSVVLDLHRMNKIIEVSEEYAYAVLEPGVSFFDLYEYIKERKLNLWPSCPALGWGSVVGNNLDRGFGYTPSGEHSQSQCGMEAVLPSGEVMRTGMFAMTRGKMGPLGFGPSVDGLFFQSNLAIVTKIGMHLFPAPKCYLDCLVSVPKELDLAVLISTVSRLEREGAIQNHASISNPFRQALSTGDPSVLGPLVGPALKGETASGDFLEALRTERGWGYWKAEFAIYGASKEIVDAYWAVVQKAFSGLKGVTFQVEASEGKDDLLLRAWDVPLGFIPHQGLPRQDGLQMLDMRGKGGGHTCFSPLYPPGGEELQAWYYRAKEIIKKSNFDLFSDFHVYGRYVIGIALVIFGPHEGAKAGQLYLELLEDAYKVDGATEYRTHVGFMDHIADHFDFGAHALKNFVTDLKGLLDPKGILSQGKSGIWAPNPE